ncbi:MAG: hypothetical protein CMJ83_12985 [Planctomycetes bacterium]|nr:hypothetical protein [Planctomycetota bacterium]
MGFVDLGRDTYVLHVCATKDVPPEWSDTVRRMVGASFADTNVTISTAANEDAVAALKGRPGVVLTSADGRHLPLPLSAKQAELTDAGWDAIDGLASSPTQDAVRAAIIDAHAVIVCFLGKRTADNDRVRRLMKEAITEAAPALRGLPKPAKSGSVTIEVSHAARARERLLMWATGCAAGEPDDPHVVVLYGRARRMGPVLSGPLVTRTAIREALVLIGQDCECDLPRSIMRGPCVPMAWSSEAADRVQVALGFDSRSPTVKAEMTRILAKAAAAQGGVTPGGDATSLLGYSETVVEPTSEPAGERASLPPTDPAEPVPDGPADSDGPGRLIPMAGVVVLVSALLGAVIVLALRRRS